MRRSVKIGVAVLAATLPMTVVAAASAPATAGVGADPRAGGSRPQATVAIDQGAVSGRLPAHFLGLSFEKSILTNGSFDSGKGNLVPLLRTLDSRGQLRFGGNMMDASTWWQPGDQPEPDWATFVFDRSHADRLAETARRSGWTVQLGTNLRNFDRDSTADEAAYVSKVLGPQLDGMACGNEIDLYPDGRDWTKQRPLWERCADVVAPHAELYGGEEADGLRPAMLNTVGSRLTSASSHFYSEFDNCFPANGGPATPDGRATFEPTDILSPAAAARTVDRVSRQVALATKANLPFRLTETNSAACLRQENVGQVYAASLWSVDHALRVAQLGASGINYHVPWDTWRICSEKVSYTPICARTEADKAGNRLSANPVYYGLLAFSYVKPGTFLPTGVASGTNTTAYAVRARNGDLQVVLVQKDAPGGTPVRVRLDGVAPHGPATTRRLTGPSLTALPDQIRFSGAQVTDAGTFTPRTTGRVVPGRHGYHLTVPTGTATIVTIRGHR